MNIPKAMKVIMIEQGVSAVDMAKGMSISRSTIYSQVGEGSNPTINTLEKYAEFMGIKTSDIILRAEAIK